MGLEARWNAKPLLPLQHPAILFFFFCNVNIRKVSENIETTEQLQLRSKRMKTTLILLISQEIVPQNQELSKITNYKFTP